MLKIAMPLATLAMGLTLLAAACGGDEPQALQIPLSPRLCRFPCPWSTRS